MSNRSYVTTILLISLALVVAVLTAGCTDTSTYGTITPPPTGTTIPESTDVTLSSAITLGKMHGTMMEAIEEALAYPVLNANEEKTDFEARIAEFDVLANQFAEEAALDRPENAETKKEFDAILVKKGELVNAAENFFMAYETDFIVKEESLTAFEDSIDDFTAAFGPFTKDYFDHVSETEFGDDGHARSALTLLLMHHDIIEGVEEAFGYLLLGETEEKDDFNQKMQDFDNSASVFAASGYLDRPENAAKLEAYSSMMQARDQMQTSASALFEDYEATGVVSSSLALVFEAEVDNLTTAYDSLLEEVLAEL